MYIEAELACPVPRKIKYVPKENPLHVDPMWLCLFCAGAFGISGFLDYFNAPVVERPLMLFAGPFLLLPFLVKAYTLYREKMLVRHGVAVPALLNMVPRRLWWPRGWLGLSGIIYELQAKYEFEGQTFVLDQLASDPTEWRGRYVTVMVNPKKPSRAVIYQICCYQVDDSRSER